MVLITAYSICLFMGAVCCSMAGNRLALLRSHLTKPQKQYCNLSWGSLLSLVFFNVHSITHATFMLMYFVLGTIYLCTKCKGQVFHQGPMIPILICISQNLITQLLNTWCMANKCEKHFSWKNIVLVFGILPSYMKHLSIMSDVWSCLTHDS